MHLAIVRSFVLVSTLAACGGAQKPAAVDNGEPAAVTNRQAPDNTAAATPSSATTDAPAASAAAPTSAMPATTGGSLADVKADDDPWLAAHRMTPDDVMKTMRGVSSKVQACWKAGLARDPSTNGEVKIRFVVANDGKVRAWRDDGSSMSDEDVTQCVGALVQGLKFPKQQSPGDAWGGYSINFTP